MFDNTIHHNLIADIINCSIIKESSLISQFNSTDKIDINSSLIHMKYIKGLQKLES